MLNLLDWEFMKDVSLKSYVGEILLEEDDGMIDLLYEKQGSYLQGKAEGSDSKNRELAKGFCEDGFPLEVISRRTGLTVDEILAL